MKSFVLFLFGSVCCILCRGQVKILSAVDSSGIGYATVQFCNLNETSSHFILANENGEVNFPSGLNKKIIVKISASGYKTYDDTLAYPYNYNLYMQSGILLDEICITTQYTASTVSNSIHKIKVIDEEQFKKSGSVNLADALRYQINLQLVQDNILVSSVIIVGLSG